MVDTAKETIYILDGKLEKKPLHGIPAAKAGAAAYYLDIKGRGTLNLFYNGTVNERGWREFRQVGDRWMQKLEKDGTKIEVITISRKKGHTPTEEESAPAVATKTAPVPTSTKPKTQTLFGSSAKCIQPSTEPHDRLVAIVIRSPVL